MSLARDLKIMSLWVVSDVMGALVACQACGAVQSLRFNSPKLHHIIILLDPPEDKNEQVRAHGILLWGAGDECGLPWVMLLLELLLLG